MERERLSDEDQVERETVETEDSGMAVYGETDIDPNREDQKSAHQAAPDEHV